VRWGIISTARINQDMLPAFEASKTSVVSAVASRDASRAKRYAELNGIPAAFGSYQELLDAPDIDAVYISLPNGLHREWVERSLLAGKHVLCEKPMTVIAREAEALFELADSRQLLLAEAFMYRHHPQTLKLQELVQSGAIGALQAIRSAFCFRVGDSSADVRYRPELAGGALRDVGCYCVSLAGFLTDSEPEQVAGFAHWATSGVDERFYGSLYFKGGIVAQFDCSLTSPAFQYASIAGSDGELYVATPWYPHAPPMSILLRNGETTEEVLTPGPNSYLLEIDDFTSAALSGSRLRISPSETIRNLCTIERLLAAASGSEQLHQSRPD
jgi:D-xylose 1-dehydrogenase (NADP+, D-xylono-1,5-lactone-forming)